MTNKLKLLLLAVGIVLVGAYAIVPSSQDAGEEPQRDKCIENCE